jgi:S-DNA-T family DNA segregation ATPase FtsK/SpoIIIE
MAKRKGTKKGKESNKLESAGKKVADTINALRSQRSKRIFGILLLVSGLLVSVAYLSYLSTWRHDQSLLVGDFSSFFMDKTIKVNNLLGKLGAWIAHLSFFKGFGLTSFVFPFLSIFFGLRLLIGRYPLPFWKTLSISAFVLVWGSLSLGYFFPSLVHLGGSVGYESRLWAVSTLGSIGTVAMIGLFMVSFIILTFNPQFRWVTSLIENISFGNDEDEEPVAVAANLTPDEDESFENLDVEELEPELKESSPVVEKSPQVVSTLSEKDLQIEDDILDSILSDDSDDFEELDPVVPITKASEAPVSDDSDFQIEKTEEEVVLSEDELNQKVKEFGEYDPTLDLSSFQLPGIDLLEEHPSNPNSVTKEELEMNKNRIVETLANYKIGIAKIKATIGPTVTLYEIVPEAGVRISKIKNLEDDIALSLAALGIRIIAPIPGKGTIGIEVPNSNPDTVSMRTVIASDRFQNTDMALPIALGKTISNETFVTDLAKMPHLLMAGATGQGKSVGLNAILVSLLYKKHPSQIKFVLVDPKKVELTLFNKIERHYLAKLPGEEEAIITDTSKVVTTLNSLCVEMDQRYDLLKEAQVRNIKEYNSKFIKRKLNPENGHRYLPYIVLVVDEFADLIMTAGKEVENPIARLAQLARAIGIHLIIATQRPSVNIITGTIKANFPARIAFRVTSKIDSRTILDSGGADQLIGRGDMLLSTGNELIRLQCAFVDTPEVEEICEFIGNQRGYPDAHLLPEYVDESASEGGMFEDSERDALFEDAARVIVMHQQGSTSLLQRKLKLGYNRAGRLVDQLEAAGIVGPFEGSKARKVLVPDEYSLEQYLNQEQES